MQQQSRGRLTCFCKACCDVIWSRRMRYKLLYEMIMFCWSYQQLAEALWLSLYCIRCKRQIIALLYRYAIAIVARAIVGETTMWRHIDIDQDDEDHGVMPVTIEIMAVLWRWRSKAQDDHGHIMSHILIAYDVYLLYILFCLVRW